ncbi:sigma-70 family RNA polymerase sigma factor [Arthrobacter koreensis]|uniref:sigma-70 family RNA polymerase sigma factor n=1 Tax=Arthrobacter koreensis TaxID=199136 RepID=UPI003AC62F07
MTQFLGKPDREARFRALYAAVYPDLLRFVQRRTGAGHAENLVAETFLVVWRRFEDLPAGEADRRAWIFGIGRNMMLNGRRGEQRRSALGVRLSEAVSVPVSSAEIDFAEQRMDVARAWRQLSEVHQEALGLAVFEDLPGPQAAAVLGISPVAYRIRLTRARRALRLLLDHLPAAAAVRVPAAERKP